MARRRLEELREEELRMIKEIPLEWILREKFCLEPVRREGDRLWYRSPFRPEKNPSFCVYTRKNDWFDYGAQVGGSVIDLAVHSVYGQYREGIALAREWLHHWRGLPASVRTRTQVQAQKEEGELDRLVRQEVGFSGQAPSRGSWLAAVRHGFSVQEARMLARLLPEGPIWCDRNGNLVARMELPLNAREWVVSGYCVRTPEGEKRDLKGSTKGIVVLRPHDLRRVQNVVICEGVRDLLAIYLRSGEARRERTVFILHPGSLAHRQEDAIVELVQVLPREVKIFCMHDRDEAGERYHRRILETLREAGFGGEVRYCPPPQGKDWFEHFHPHSSQKQLAKLAIRAMAAPAPTPA